MDWSKYYPANYSAITAEDVKQILEKKIAPVEDNTNDASDDGDEMDKVQPKALKKKFDDRKDKDIDNDGDTDDSDEVIHAKRKAISKAIAKQDEGVETKKKTTIKKLPSHPGYSTEEEVEPVDELSTGLLKRAAGAAEKDAATQRDAQDYATRVKGKGHAFGADEAGKKALKRANQASKFSAAADVNDSPYKKAIRAKKESWYPVDEKRLNQKRKHNKKDYRDDNLKKKVKGIEEPEFSKKQDTVTNMEWATKVFNNYHNIEEHCGWCDQTESKEMPTSQAMAGQIKELAKAIRGKDKLSIEGAASLVAKKQYDKLAPYLDKMSEDARQSILMVLMTDQKIANSVMKKMKTEEYDTCEIPSHRFILAEMYKKYQGMTWGEIGERLIKNTERRLVSLAYATKMGTIDAPSPEVQKLADECELEDLEKASKTFIEDDSDLKEQLENETIDEIVRVYNSFNEDEKAAVDAIFNQDLSEDELLAELPNPIKRIKQAYTQRTKDKLQDREDRDAKHDQNVADIKALKKQQADRKAAEGPGLLKKAWNKISGKKKPEKPEAEKSAAGKPAGKPKRAKTGGRQKGTQNKAAAPTTDEPKKKEDPTADARKKQDDAEKGAKDSSADSTAIKKDKPATKKKPLPDDPSLKQGVKTSTRGKALNLGTAAIGAIAGSYEPEGPSIEEDETIERLDARRRIFKEKIKKLAYEKAKEILGKRQPVEVDVTNETNKNNKSDDGDGLDAVQPMALKKKSAKDRKDPDIDNDGDTDDSDEFLHKKRKAISKAMEDKEEDSSKVKETGKINNKVEMNPDEDKMKKESTGLAFVRKYKSKMNEGNTNPLHDQILELFRSSYASVDGEPAGAEFAVDDKPASAASIARALRCSPMEVQKMLDDMVEAGQISRVGDAYSYASPRPVEPMGSKPAEAQH